MSNGMQRKKQIEDSKRKLELLKNSKKQIIKGLSEAERLSELKRMQDELKKQEKIRFLETPINKTKASELTVDQLEQKKAYLEKFTTLTEQGKKSKELIDSELKKRELDEKNQLESLRIDELETLFNKLSKAKESPEYERKLNFVIDEINRRTKEKSTK